MKNIILLVLAVLFRSVLICMMNFTERVVNTKITGFEIMYMRSVIGLTTLSVYQLIR